MARTTTWPAVRACGVCGRPKRIQRAATGSDPDMCQACWKRDQRSWRICGRCGELRPTQGRDPADHDKAICQRCYRHARPSGTCERCGCTGRLARTGACGGPKLCGACADRAGRGSRECGRCGKVKPVAARTGADGTPDLCFACYDGTPRRVCGGCGELAAIHVRGRNGQPDLCRRCHWPPVRRCSVCGREKPCAYADTPAPVCWSCKPRRAARCAVCGEQRPVKARSAIGPLCQGCEWRRLRAKATCERCGQTRRPALHLGDEVLCGDCAGIPQTRVCTRCGLEDITYDRGLCPGCSLQARLERWRASGPTASVARLEPYLSALEHSRTPVTILQYLGRTGGNTLADLVHGRIDLSHEALDALDRGKSTEDLRAALVDQRVLEPRDETLTVMERWTSNRLTTTRPGPDAVTLRAFATWKITRELAARRARRPGPDPLATTMPKHWIAAAINLTSWLHTHQRTLADLDQPQLDAWMAQGSATRRRTIRPFVAWLEREERRGLRVPASQASARNLALDDHKRLTALRALLHDETIETQLRLAGYLVALYAQPVARIVRLSATDLTITDAGANVDLNGTPIALPASLRRVACDMRAAATEWLFPGQKAGRPTHPMHLSRRLRELGLPVAAARPSAMAALAHQIPAPVLADVLGFSAHTICAASSELKVDYARYVARRS